MLGGGLRIGALCSGNRGGGCYVNQPRIRSEWRGTHEQVSRARRPAVIDSGQPQIVPWVYATSLPLLIPPRGLQRARLLCASSKWPKLEACALTEQFKSVAE